MRYMIVVLLLCSACTLGNSQQPVETLEITDVPTPGEQVESTITPSVTTAPPTAAPTEEVMIDGCPVPTGWVIYEIKAGETLGALARARNITADEIAEANCLDNPNTIFEGQQIVLPPELGTE